MAFDLVAHTKKYKGNLHEFFLDMRSWSTFRTKAKLDWQRVDFTPSNQSVIPKQRGLYVFSVESRTPKLPSHGYILYLGLTGDEESDSNLYKRYGQYVRQQAKKNGRPAVTYMLDNWAEHLAFYYCPIVNPKVSLARIETRFLDALIPPVNKRDMDAAIISVKAAAF
jgi:hypothetical protein